MWRSAGGASARHEERLSRPRTAALLLLVALPLAACGEGARAPGQRPDVLVVSFDALRADHLGAYGYELETSPRLDDFASQALVFERAYTTGQATPSSFAAAFTGIYPFASLADGRLRAELTLAEAFQRAGYRTGALLANRQLAEGRGFERGFDDYHALGGDDERRLADLAARWLTRWRETPFFLWVHFISPHAPYVRRDEAEHLYDAGYHGPYAESSSRRGVPTRRADRRRWVSLYNGEIYAVDRLFGELIEQLDDFGLSDRTIVVVTSDHGEELFERGQAAHFTLYEEVRRVPLMIRIPGRQATRVPEPVANIDLMPTLLSLAGIEIPVAVDGIDVSTSRPADRPLLGVAMTNTPLLMAAISRGQRKLLVRCVGERDEPSEHRGASGDRWLELYDLAADPGESKERSGRDPDEAAALLRELESRMGDSPCRSMRRADALWRQRRVDPETRHELEALGYVE